MRSGVLMREIKWNTDSIQHAVHAAHGSLHGAMTCLTRGVLMPMMAMQALTSAMQRTHNSRLALAAMMPIVAKWAAARCARSDASYWDSQNCSLANMPLVHLLLIHVLLIAAVAATLLATGKGIIAQV